MYQKYIILNVIQYCRQSISLKICNLTFYSPFHYKKKEHV